MEQATGYAPALRRGEDEQAGLSRGTELGASFRGARAAGRSPDASRGRLAGARLAEAGPFPLVAKGRRPAYSPPTALKIGMFASLAT